MLQVTGGPAVPLRLCAEVTVPAVTVSTNALQFDTVQCGMCQVDKNREEVSHTHILVQVECNCHGICHGR